MISISQGATETGSPCVSSQRSRGQATASVSWAALLLDVLGENRFLVLSPASGVPALLGGGPFLRLQSQEWHRSSLCFHHHSSSDWFSSRPPPLIRTLVMTLPHPKSSRPICPPRDPYRNFLLLQWLKLCPPNTECLGLNPGQGTRSHKLQLRVHMLQLKDSAHCNKYRRSCMPQLRLNAA